MSAHRAMASADMFDALLEELASHLHPRGLAVLVDTSAREAAVSRDRAPASEPGSPRMDLARDDATAPAAAAPAAAAPAPAQVEVAGNSTVAEEAPHALRVACALETARTLEAARTLEMAPAVSRAAGDEEQSPTPAFPAPARTTTRAAVAGPAMLEGADAAAVAPPASVSTRSAVSPPHRPIAQPQMAHASARPAAELEYHGAASPADPSTGDAARIAYTAAPRRMTEPSTQGDARTAPVGAMELEREAPVASPAGVRSRPARAPREDQRMAQPVRAKSGRRTSDDRHRAPPGNDRGPLPPRADQPARPAAAVASAASPDAAAGPPRHPASALLGESHGPGAAVPGTAVPGAAVFDAAAATNVQMRGDHFEPVERGPATQGMHERTVSLAASAHTPQPLAAAQAQVSPERALLTAARLHEQILDILVQEARREGLEP